MTEDTPPYGPVAGSATNNDERFIEIQRLLRTIHLAKGKIPSSRELQRELKGPKKTGVSPTTALKYLGDYQGWVARRVKDLSDDLMKVNKIPDDLLEPMVSLWERCRDRAHSESERHFSDKIKKAQEQKAQVEDALTRAQARAEKDLAQERLRWADERRQADAERITLSQTVEKLRVVLDQANAARHEVEEQLHANQRELESAQARNDSLSTELTEKDKRYADTEYRLKGEIATAHEQMQERERAFEARIATLDVEARQHAEAAQSQAQRFTDEIADLRAQLTQVQSDLTATRSAFNSEKDRAADLLEQRDRARRELENTNARFDAEMTQTKNRDADTIEKLEAKLDKERLKSGQWAAEAYAAAKKSTELREALAAAEKKLDRLTPD